MKHIALKLLINFLMQIISEKHFNFDYLILSIFPLYASFYENMKMKI